LIACITFCVIRVGLGLGLDRELSHP